MNDVQTTYQINQKIVYPSQGVGKITEIKKKTFKDQELLYYVIYLEVSDMTVMIPVEKAEELGIRSIVSPEEAQQALDMISEEFEPIPSDWKLRYQINLDLLKKGSVLDIATIVRSLYHRSKIKELPILERKLYDSAKKLLEDEITFALDKSPKEVEALIHSKLEPLGADGEVRKSPFLLRAAQLKAAGVFADEEDDDVVMADEEEDMDDGDMDSMDE